MFNRQELRETSEKQRFMVSESTKHLNEMLQQKNALEEVCMHDSLIFNMAFVFQCVTRYIVP